jgi:hypothetical protein
LNGNEVSDITKCENLYKIYLKIKEFTLHKPIAEIDEAYSTWKYEGHWDGGVFFFDPKSGILGFPAIGHFGDGSDYRIEKLIGDEICTSYYQTLGFFFPDEIWPEFSNDDEIVDFFSKFFGINFAKSEGGCSVNVLDYGFVIYIYTDEEISSNTLMHIMFKKRQAINE